MHRNVKLLCKLYVKQYDSSIYKKQPNINTDGSRNQTVLGTNIF